MYAAQRPRACANDTLVLGAGYAALARGFTSIDPPRIAVERRTWENGMATGELTRVALTLIATLGLTVSAHVAAPTARGECDGGLPYTEAVGLARGAIVGVISQVGHDVINLPYVAEVTVERAVGAGAGPSWRGQAYAGMACEGDEPSVGARVVILLDVTILSVPPSDTFYTIGVAVTPAQVSRLASDLPDTATAGAAELATGPRSSVWLAVVAAVAAASALVHWGLWHRMSRAG
jgi:hypothetical protein